MTRVLDLPAVEHETLPSPPLKAMLGQVRFPPILRIADPSGLAVFQESLREEFPHLSEEQQISITIGPEGPTQKTDLRQWRFSSADKAWSIVLSPSFLTVEAAADRYTSYKAFRETFARIWEVALSELQPARRLQQGLRYIDHIEKELPGPEWASFINPELLGPIADQRFGDRLKQAICDLRFELDSGQLAFKHGILTAGPENRVGYLLDFDYFEQEESEDLTVKTILSRFDAFHDEIYALFRWCITDKALEEFRRGND